MHTLIEALVDSVRQQGVSIHYGAEVKQLSIFTPTATAEHLVAEIHDQLGPEIKAVAHPPWHEGFIGQAGDGLAAGTKAQQVDGIGGDAAAQGWQGMAPVALGGTESMDAKNGPPGERAVGVIRLEDAVPDGVALPAPAQLLQA
jgi:hypothetical protein